MADIPKPIYLRVGRRIAELRRKAGRTQEELAEELDLGWRYISKVERGLENLGLDTLEKFATALRVNIKELFEDARGEALQVKQGRPRKS